mmetsp:Transcript_26935/g.56521  ORF Transcript_26935/g.56521 Transcript_26935/m.56521 type:complete len:118 (+) Transcript_26935:185-538(+)
MNSLFTDTVDTLDLDPAERELATLAVSTASRSGPLSFSGCPGRSFLRHSASACAVGDAVDSLAASAPGVLGASLKRPGFETVGDFSTGTMRSACACDAGPQHQQTMMRPLAQGCRFK